MFLLKFNRVGRYLIDYGNLIDDEYKDIINEGKFVN